MKMFTSLDEVFDTMDEARMYIEQFDATNGTEDDIDMLESIENKYFDLKCSCEGLRDDIDNELAQKASTDEEEEEETDTKST